MRSPPRTVAMQTSLQMSECSQSIGLRLVEIEGPSYALAATLAESGECGAKCGGALGTRFGEALSFGGVAGYPAGIVVS